MDGWQLLQSGDFDNAISRFETEYAQHRAPGIRVNIGIAHLCADRPLEAKEVFDDVVKMLPESEGVHIMAGTARWLLNDPADAITVWRIGLSCAYTDPAGGMGTALLLHFASLMQAGLVESNEAVTLIQNRLHSQRSGKWPASIGRFVLRQMTAEEVLTDAAYRMKDGELVPRNEVTAKQNVARFNFYLGVDAYSRRDERRFLKFMSLCWDAVGCETMHERYLSKHLLANQRERHGP